MAATTGTINIYQSWLDYLTEGANNSSDTFIVLLTTSSHTPSSSTHSTLSDITNELSGNGYSRQTLGSVTSTQSGGTYTFDAANATFTASGGSLTARNWHIFNDTLAGDPLVAWGLIDNTPADAVASDTNSIELQWNASGIYTIS